MKARRVFLLSFMCGIECTTWVSINSVPSLPIVQFKWLQHYLSPLYRWPKHFIGRCWHRVQSLLVLFRFSIMNLENAWRRIYRSGSVSTLWMKRTLMKNFGDDVMTRDHSKTSIIWNSLIVWSWRQIEFWWMVFGIYRLRMLMIRTHTSTGWIQPIMSKGLWLGTVPGTLARF